MPPLSPFNSDWLDRFTSNMLVFQFHFNWKTIFEFKEDTASLDLLLIALKLFAVIRISYSIYSFASFVAEICFHWRSNTFIPL